MIGQLCIKGYAITLIYYNEISYVILPCFLVSITSDMNLKGHANMAPALDVTSQTVSSSPAQTLIVLPLCVFCAVCVCVCVAGTHFLFVYS
jgi:hypothetical protein